MSCPCAPSFLFFTVLFFFFQAEDGIRDTSVTGVQTCALPISSPPRRRTCCRWRRRGRASIRCGPHQGCSCCISATESRRSEERRVGKEWRTGRVERHYKQKLEVDSETWKENGQREGELHTNSL